MTHAAKKIAAGEYEYRGWAISHVFSETWNDWAWYIQPITADQGRGWFDPTQTLRQAKQAIDEVMLMEAAS